MKFTILKKILPASFTLNTAKKPMHTGEIFHIWNCLTISYQMKSSLETFLMNSNDKTVHKLIKEIVDQMRNQRVPKLENLLKDAGFTVPPRPPNKLLQGEPGVGTEVKLSDDEAINIMFNLSSFRLKHDGRGISTVTTEDSIRDLFIELLKQGLTDHEAIILLGKKRQAFNEPPPAVAKPKGPTIGDIYWLWKTMEYLKFSSIVLLETYISNTNDTELKKHLEHGLYKVTVPHLMKLEKALKNVGFTVPPRPVDRMNQQSPGTFGNIVLPDDEIIRVIISAGQFILDQHIRAYAAIINDDYRALFKGFVIAEIDNIKRNVRLAKTRDLLQTPPQVTAKR